MADITLRDLLHWERGLRFRAPGGEPPDTGLDRAISWAVTIRASSPILPALRGGEIVIAPPRLLEQMRSTESIGRDDLVHMLGGQPIAALMVDPSFHEGPVRGVPLLVSSGTFPHDAESVLNRLITERRAELYRLGSDLSRALSTATMIGAGLDALLEAAETAGRRALVLQSAEGAVMARSRGAETRPPPAATDCLRLAEAGSAGPTVLAMPGSRDCWLSLVVTGTEQRRRGARGAVLSVALAPDTSMESERLIVTQTASAVELLLRQVSDGALLVRDRGHRETLVSDLLLGRLVSREAADARVRLLGLDATAAARVALFASERAGGNIVSAARSALADERTRVSAAISDHEFAVVLTGATRYTADLADVVSAQRLMRAQDDTLVLAVSEAVDGPARATQALEQARLLVRLARCGAIEGAVLRAGDVDQIGFYSLFLAHSIASDRTLLRQRLDAFATPLLGILEEHDTSRGSDLVRTLDAYLRQGGALALAADRLGIHRNTLSYRLGRIAELTGRDLNDPHSRFLLQVALNARALQQALGSDGPPTGGRT
jgi:PucR family transcriptional regulator, purine catabolism regulatory protein